jgi:hypothetical protein
MNDILQAPAPSSIQPSSATKLLFKKQLIVLFLLVAVRCVTLYAIPDEVGPVAKVKGLTLPNTIDNWKGKDVKVDPFVYEVLHPEAVLQKRYALAGSGGGSGAKGNRPTEVEVLAMYTRDTEGFHPPDVCM